MNKRIVKATLSVAILFSIVTSNVAMSVEGALDTLQQYPNNRIAPVSPVASAKTVANFVLEKNEQIADKIQNGAGAIKDFFFAPHDIVDDFNAARQGIKSTALHVASAVKNSEFGQGVKQNLNNGLEFTKEFGSYFIKNVTDTISRTTNITITSADDIKKVTNVHINNPNALQTVKAVPAQTSEYINGIRQEAAVTMLDGFTALAENSGKLIQQEEYARKMQLYKKAALALAGSVAVLYGGYKLYNYWYPTAKTVSDVVPQDVVEIIEQ